MVAAQHVKHQGGVGDGAGQWADAGEAVEGLGIGPGGDAPALGLDADEVAPAGGNAHRAGSVRAETGRDDVRGDSCGRAAAGAPWGVLEAPGIARGTEGLALGEG